MNNTAAIRSLCRRMLQRSAVTIGAVVLGTLCLVAMVHASPAHAQEEEFCVKAWLGPYGSQPGDRCTAPQGGYVYFVQIRTYERAGCFDIVNNGELLTYWICTGNNNITGTTYGGKQWAHGIIRNNNTNNGGYFSGKQNYLPTPLE